MTLREATCRRRTLGRATFPLGPWRDRPVDVRLTALGRRLTSRVQGVRTAVALTRDRSEPLRWIIVLRR